MMRFLGSIVWLTLVWLALWESFTVGNVLAGAAVASMVVLLVPGRTRHHTVGFRPIAGVRLLGVFLWQLVRASAVVAWEIITPGNRSRPAVVSVRLATNVATVATAVANMVSLTPGTLTIDVDEDTMTLFIHVLHFESSEATSRDVHRLETLVAAAFPSRAKEAS